MIGLAIALVMGACGVVLPPAEDADGTEPSMNDPVTTKGASMPTPNGSDGETGVLVSGAPGGSGDAGDAGDAGPPGPRVYAVFVTSQVWGSDEIGGLSGADSKCANLAGATQSLKGRKWAAWLSTGSTLAAARLGATPGAWARPDGTSVASNRSQLTDKLLPLFTSIAIDEKGASHGGDWVWTGTRSDGNASSDTCNGWNSSSGRGLFGKVEFQKPYWTEAGDLDCNGDFNQYQGILGKPRNRLYCFEID